MERDLASIRNRSLMIGVVLLGLCGLGALAGPDQFFRSYLLGWVFWGGLAIGCMPLIMLHHLTGGAWGLVIRRVLEAGVGTLPLVAVLFVPVIVGLGRIYVWARPEVVAADPLLQHKAAYLNAPFFVGRTVLYFAIWIAMAQLLIRWSSEQDRTGDVALARRMQLFSGPGIGVVGLTGTFAAVDWVMSLDPHWFSTIFGMLFLAGQNLSAFALSILLLFGLSDRKPLAGVVQPSIYQDLGKLLLAFVMLWAYLSFSQFLIIYSGNLVEEIPYFLERGRGGWQWVGGALIVLHFAVPFVLLLSRDLKRNGAVLAGVAGFVLLMRFVDTMWMIMPSLSASYFVVHWMDLAAPLGIGGVWLWMLLGRLEARPLLPVHDPYAEETFADAAEQH
ncbi:MAG: hypothetical protein ACREQ9_00650 [Candidatus Binatia bacterium]